MSLGELTTPLLVRAVQVYFELAYPEGGVPDRSRPFAEIDPSTALADVLSLPKVEKLPSPTPGKPGGYALRLGNAWYPHMKLLIQPYGLPPGVVFGVDTHDRVHVPAGSPEAEELHRLKENNLELARKVEAAWESAGIPTQKGLLRKALADARSQRLGEGSPT